MLRRHAMRSGPVTRWPIDTAWLVETTGVRLGGLSGCPVSQSARLFKVVSLMLSQLTLTGLETLGGLWWDSSWTIQSGIAEASFPTSRGTPSEPMDRREKVDTV